MKFIEWLQWACLKRDDSYNPKRMYENYKLPVLCLHDGIWVSVQASFYHACEPRETLSDAKKYKSVEVYYLGERPEGLDESKLIDDHTYGNVSIEEMEDFCKLHRGIYID